MSIVPKVGDLFDNRYQIIREIDKGGMGAVYQAVDRHTNQTVAIKLILPDKAIDMEMVQRFRKEAKALKRLNHPHIVKLYNYNLQHDPAYIVLEYLTGQTLQKRLDDKYRFPIPEAIRIIKQLGEALEHAHPKGFVHRDLKPSNIMLTEQGQAILMDFGIVKIEDSVQLTIAGSVIGSAAYMSPEQANGKELDFRTDIYSLGAIFYQLLTSHLPFPGETPAGVMFKIITQSPPNIRELNPDVPELLVEIVAKAMHKDKMQRYGSATEFIQVLSHLNNYPIAIYPGPIHPRTPTWSLPSRGGQRRSTSWLLLSVFSFIVVISFVVVFHLVRNTFPPERELPTPVTPGLATTQASPIKTNPVTLSVVDGSGEITTKVLPSVTPDSPDVTPNRSEPTLIPTYTNTPTIRRITVTATVSPSSFGVPDAPTSTLVPPLTTPIRVTPIKTIPIPTTPPPIYDTPTPKSETSKNIRK